MPQPPPSKPKVADIDRQVTASLRKAVGLYQGVTTDLVASAALQKAISSEPEWKSFNSDVALQPLVASEKALKDRSIF